MKTKLTFILFFSFCLGFSQEKDSVKTKYQYKPNFTVGVDVLNAALSTFSDRKLFQGYISSEIKKNLHAVLDVDYGNNNILTVVRAAKVDSALIPIRVDDAGFTELYVRKTKKGNVSKIKLNYNTTSEYVSPACGFKRLYQNLSGTLETANPVTKVELNQNQIINENKAHLYLVF